MKALKKKNEIIKLRKQRDLLLFYLDTITLRCMTHEIGTKQNAGNEMGIMVTNIALIMDVVSMTRHFGLYFAVENKDVKISMENVEEYKNKWNKYATENVIPQFQESIKKLTEIQKKPDSTSYIG